MSTVYPTNTLTAVRVVHSTVTLPSTQTFTFNTAVEERTVTVYEKDIQLDNGILMYGTPTVNNNIDYETLPMPPEYYNAGLNMTSDAKRILSLPKIAMIVLVGITMLNI